MKILLQDKNIVLANNSLISINSDNIAENGNLIRTKQDSKNNIIKINNSLVRAKVLHKKEEETWIINDNFTNLATIIESVNFTSNGSNYTQLKINISLRNSYIYYDNIKVCNIEVEKISTDTYVINPVWTNSAYRTIIFASSATGDLLTWLQANAVKQ